MVVIVLLGALAVIPTSSAHAESDPSTSVEQEPPYWCQKGVDLNNYDGDGYSAWSRCWNVEVCFKFRVVVKVWDHSAGGYVIKHFGLFKRSNGKRSTVSWGSTPGREYLSTRSQVRLRPECAGLPTVHGFLTPTSAQSFACQRFANPPAGWSYSECFNIQPCHRARNIVELNPDFGANYPQFSPWVYGNGDNAVNTWDPDNDSYVRSWTQVRLRPICK